jgi:hypothetical protein
MNFILRFSTATKQHFYFVNHGESWPHRPGFRLISETTQNRDNARRFGTHEEAIAALKLSDDPPGWLVDEVAE